MGVITYLWTNFDYLSTGFDRLLIKSVGLLEEMNAFPGIAQSVGLLFATILVAIAIMLFSKEKDFYVLDRNLILDHVIKTERFLVGIGLIFFPLFFWEVAKGEIRFFIIFLWCLGVCYMIAILVNSYCWMKKNKFEIRFNYLRDTKNLKDVGGSWNSIWETGDISILNEIRFFEIFSFKIDSFLKNIKTLDIASEEKRIFYVGITRAKEKVYLLTEIENESNYIEMLMK